MDKLEFTDWSEVQRRFGSGDIAIFRQGGPKRPPLYLKGLREAHGLALELPLQSSLEFWHLTHVLL